jgi:hypothetical protein
MWMWEIRHFSGANFGDKYFSLTKAAQKLGLHQSEWWSLVYNGPGLLDLCYFSMVILTKFFEALLR